MIRSPRSVSFILTDGVRRLWPAQCFKCISKLLEFQVAQGFKYSAWTLMGYHILILDTFGLAQQEADCLRQFFWFYVGGAVELEQNHVNYVLNTACAGSVSCFGTGLRVRTVY